VKPELGRSQSPAWRGVPPHMARRDLALWYRFLDRHGSEYQAIFYDVALGDGTDPGPDQLPEYRFGFIRLTRLRADAIAVRPAGWTLFEVRPAAGAGALGAIVTYRALWEADPPDKRPLEAILITDTIKPELRPIYAGQDVRILLV